MKITPRNLIRHEIIGLDVEVIESKNPSLKGLKGQVIYETMKLLIIRDWSGKVKKIPKDVCIFNFKLPEGFVVRVDGKILVGRPEDRVKKKLKYW